MKRHILLRGLICLVVLFLCGWNGGHKVQAHTVPADSAISVVTRLTERVMPGKSSCFTFKIVPGKKKFYRVSGKKGKICIEGDSPVSLTSGLHRYMRDYLHAEVSWTNFQPSLPEVFPCPERTVYAQSPFPFVTYMNYCTFGYSTVFWDWERWEQELDWMALHGVTHPLAMVGVENVWYRFLTKLGYTDAEAKKFLTGPVYMPWLLMGNMETLGGPMSDGWLQRQLALQHKIVNRMRSLGMEPIFQGFYGMVPSDFGKHHPSVKLIEQGKWNTFDRPAVLSPLDPEFPRLAQLWYSTYKELFGDTRYYGGDLFHEGGKTGGLNLTACAQAVEREMVLANEQAVWVLQSWGQNPVADLLRGLSARHAMVVELCGEYWHRWKDRGGYEGIPWAWSNISNWGGNIGLHGRLDAIASQPAEGLNHSVAGKTMKGIGFTPEGIETNPVVPALWSELVWRDRPLVMDDWLDRYVYQRYSVNLSSLREAWRGFYHTAYGTYPGSRRPSEPVFCANPSLQVKTVSAWSQCKIFYDPKPFGDACELFLRDADMLKHNRNYQYDAVDMVRQYLSDLGRATYADIQQAWNSRNRVVFNQATQRFLQLIQDQDQLLRTHPMFSFATWLDDARKAGETLAMQHQYVYYNKLIVTSWDKVEGSLNDYTHRELGGLLGSYYYKRWKLYFNYLDQKWDNPAMPEPYLFGFTRTWLYEELSEALAPVHCNPVEQAVNVFTKYRKKAY